MKRIFGKSLSLFMVAVLILGLVQFAPNAVKASAAESGKLDSLTWTLDDEGTLEISGSGIINCGMVGESSPWKGKDTIKRIVINEGITSIGNGAFSRCANLEEISFPDSLNSVCAAVFASCKGLKNIVLPDNITDVAYNAFQSCSGLTSVTLSNNMSYIDSYTFSGCYSLKRILIPAKTTLIDESAFAGCSGLKDVFFCGTEEQWNRILIETGNEYLLKATVHFNFARSGELPGGLRWNLDAEGVLTISGEGVMPDYNGWAGKFAPWIDQRQFITKVVIEDGVTSIGDFAFTDCANLTEIEIPDSVVSIGGFSLGACTQLKNVDIPESVDSIGAFAFSNSGLTSVIIHDNTELGESVFSQCMSLESAILEDGVTAIPVGAFEQCSSLKEITIPKNVKVIEERVFSGCGALEKVTFCGYIELVSKDAFANCGSLADVYYPGTKTQWKNVSVLENNECLLNAKIHYMTAEAVRLSGPSRYDTAVAISNKGWESADTVVLANSMSYADALAGVPYAYQLDAPILLTAGKAVLEPEVMAQIQKLNPKKIVILGGKGVISNEIKAELEKNYEVERVSGTDRYLTAVEISKRVNEAPETAIIVTGTGYADALSISPYAALKKFPIVYSNPKTALTEETLEYLKSANNILIIGGPGAVGENTVKQLEGKSIERLRGSDRYLTSYAIVEKFQAEFGNDVMLATGVDFPDALAGGVLAAKLKTPLLLTHPSGVNNEIKNYILGKSPENIYILGGKGAMPDSIVEKIYA